ncbi:MAG: glycosyl hydrolase [Planctomycetota bacterium]
MKNSRVLFFLLICAVCVSCVNESGSGGAAEGLGANPDSWPFAIQVQHRPGTYWWVPGSAWDKESIDWNLEKLKEGGIGAAHIVPIYGAKGYEDRYIDFLSDEWVENLHYILRKADRLDMQVDMTTGTGWCFGGPTLAADHQDTRVRLDPDSGTLKFDRKRMVKRAAPGGEGHMLNPLSPSAMKEYLKRFDKALSASEILPRAQYHDSYEYKCNWSADMRNAFKKRRGYDMNDHLDTLFGEAEATDMTRRIKYDYRLTTGELHQEYIRLWAQWAASKRMLTRNQAHGSPANLLDTYAAAAIPETEMFGSPEFAVAGFRREEQFCRPGDSNPRVSRMASSAAHVAHEPGRQLVSSESCTWMRDHWHGTLGQIKLEMDLFFLAGINHVFYHGSCYSAKDVPWPGWYFYASTKADWRNSIYRDMPVLNEYIARCQSMLQAGEPANDILLYWPIHDMWMEADGLLKHLAVHGTEWMDNYRIGELAGLLEKKGYAFDFVSDRMLDTIRSQKGKLVAPGGTYRVIVIPRCQYLPASTAKRLADLATDGATIIFEEKLPADVPGLGGLQSRRADFARAMGRLRKSVTIGDISSRLGRAAVKREKMVDLDLSWIRRKINGSHWYFVANHSAKDHSGWVKLAVQFRSAIVYDPMTRDSAMLASDKNGQVYLEIASGQSLIIHASNSEGNARPYKYMKPSGDAISLEGRWEVEFIDGLNDLPQAYRTESLSSWTDAPDEKARVFAGTARYRLSFDLKDVSADDYMLDLGDVRESARVRINGVDAAALVALPMRCRVGRYLKKGNNTIEIEVTNLTANLIRDYDKRGLDWKIMRDINIVTPHYKKFDASIWPLQPSGLLGPVTLRPLSEAVIKD